jgi:hypothetical protein
MFKAKRPSGVIQAAAIQAAAQIVLFAASRKDGEVSPDELVKVVAVGAQSMLREFEKRQPQ